jgi:hypothetical protein
LILSITVSSGLLKTSYSGNSCFSFILILNFEIQGTSSSGCSKELNKKHGKENLKKKGCFVKGYFIFFKHKFEHQGYIILEHILWFLENGDY